MADSFIVNVAEQLKLRIHQDSVAQELSLIRSKRADAAIVECFEDLNQALREKIAGIKAELGASGEDLVDSSTPGKFHIRKVANPRMWCTLSRSNVFRGFRAQYDSAFGAGAPSIQNLDIYLNIDQDETVSLSVQGHPVSADEIAQDIIRRLFKVQ